MKSCGVLSSLFFASDVDVFGNPVNGILVSRLVRVFGGSQVRKLAAGCYNDAE